RTVFRADVFAARHADDRVEVDRWRVGVILRFVATRTPAPSECHVCAPVTACSASQDLLEGGAYSRFAMRATEPIGSAGSVAALACTLSPWSGPSWGCHPVVRADSVRRSRPSNAATIDRTESTHDHHRSPPLHVRLQG